MSQYLKLKIKNKKCLVSYRLIFTNYVSDQLPVRQFISEKYIEIW